MTRLLVSVVLAAVCAPAAHADLRYTTRVEMRRTSTNTTNPDDVAMGAVLRTMMPPGEMRTFVSGEGIRIELTTGSIRSVLLMRSDGPFLVYPDLRAYMRLPTSAELLATPGEQPTFRRTGDFVTMLGVRAERILVTLPVVLPMTPPAGAPTRIHFEGEIWVADVYRAEARGVQKALGAAVLQAGVEGGMEGMVLRQILRNVEFGYEVESTVVELVDAPIPAGMFVVPADYRELNQPPVPDAPGGSRRR